jgi:hypothetical protein
MKRLVTALIIALGLALVVGGGVWAVSGLRGTTGHTASEVVLNPQLSAVPNGSVATGDGSMGR